MITHDPALIGPYLTGMPDGRMSGVGWLVDGQVRAALGIESCDGYDCWVHINCEIPAREWVLAVLRLIYSAHAAERASAWIADDNVACIRLAKAIGAGLEHTRVRSRSGAQVHLYSLRRDTGIHRRLRDAGKLI